MPSPADKLAMINLFKAVSLVERGKPVLSELAWALFGIGDEKNHVKILPDYCYNIFDVFRRTLFKGFPLFSDTVAVTEPAALASVKTIDAARKVMRIDWKNMGRIVGIASRCVRFGELESGDELELDNVNGATREKKDEFLALIFGRKWADENVAIIRNEGADQILSAKLREYAASRVAGIQGLQPKYGALAYQWSPIAMADFNLGISEGLKQFIDENGQFAGQSPRTGIYGFLLIAWPEIKAMLDLKPRKTLSDLHAWLLPFMRSDMLTYIEIETLRDICAPRPSGIGLTLRPLKSRARRSSA